MNKVSLGILISGRGSNMDALIQASKHHQIDADISVVICDKPDALGIKKAKEYGITTFSLDLSTYSSKKEYEDDIIRILKGCGVDIICLAGYMRLVGQDLLDTFPNRVINIHPSLLPAFKGLDAQKQALEYGVKFAGCTVHYVNHVLDGGPIIDQLVVDVLENDTVETLSQRILAQEHLLYPKAVQKVIETILVTQKG